MTAENSAQVENPAHFLYLKSFRTDVCKEFLEKRCSLHRPFTCFNWHFPNQRRRRPVRNAADGTFNYSADIYCKNYDDASGTCPEKEACRCLHRNLGDTEKRYHLRYYKTEICVSDADNNGHCMRNGIHCAFAHSEEDLRVPVFETTSRSVDASGSVGGEISRRGFMSENVMEGSAEIDDPRWTDREYLLQNYKTEPCQSKSRTCRPIVACCPYYHSPKDRRRNPGTQPYKYRGVACSHVKLGDEWGSAEDCYRGDECIYSHTRVELQYHPEVYARVQCENELKANCRKGAFCAFAHSGKAAENHLSNGGQNMAYSRASSATSDARQSTVGHGRGVMPNSWLNFSSLKLDTHVAGHKFNSPASHAADPTLQIFHSPPPASTFTSAESGVFGSNSSLYSSNTLGSVAGSNKVGDGIGLLDRLDSHDDTILDELDDASLMADAQQYGGHSYPYVDTGRPPPGLSNKDARPPPGWYGGTTSSEFESMKLELERAKHVARTNFDDKISAAKERDQALQALSKMKDEVVESQQARPIGGGATANVVSGDLEKMAFPVLQRKETQLRLDLIKLQEVMYRKANGKCVICLDKMAVDALLPCRHRSVCGSCRHETDECPICHVQFPTK